MKKSWNLIGRISYVLAWPILYFLFKGTNRTRVIVCSGDKVLFVKDWLGNGTWKLPGGGVHKNEDPEVAAARELQEETGIKLPGAKLKKFATCGISESEMPYRCYAFEVEVPDVDVSIKRHIVEISDCTWMNYKSALNAPDVSKATQRLLSLWRQ